MLPLLKKSADPRIVNMASFTGMLKIIKSQEIRDAFTASDLTIDKLHSLMEWFVGAVEEGRHADEGWPNTCYGTSKLGVIVYTQLLAKQEPGIMVNCCCPGHCKTDMSSHSGDKTATEGAHVPVMLATKEHHKVTGRFYNVDGDITAKWFEV